MNPSLLSCKAVISLARCLTLPHIAKDIVLTWQSAWHLQWAHTPRVHQCSVFHLGVTTCGDQQAWLSNPVSKAFIWKKRSPASWALLTNFSINHAIAHWRASYAVCFLSPFWIYSWWIWHLFLPLRADSKRFPFSKKSGRWDIFKEWRQRAHCDGGKLDISVTCNLVDCSCWS